MNDIIFNRGRGGLGRALSGKDHVSGIVLESVVANIPAALTGAGNYQVIYSVQDAQDLGIQYDASSANLEIDNLRYTIDRIFDANEKAEVHLLVANTTNSETAVAGLITLQNKAQGEIRQAVVLKPATDFDASELAPLQASCDTLEAQHKPLSVLYACNFMGVSSAAITDLRALDSKNISVVFGMDGNGIGSTLAIAYTKSFTCAGTVLGVLSGSKVSENIGWVGAFNVNKNDINEYDVIKLADGRLFDTIAISEKDALSVKGYIFLLKHIGLAGSYFNDSYTCISASDDFAFIENNRTIDKAVRNTRTFLLPKLNSPLFVNSNGTLTEDTIASFKNDAERSLEELQRNGELSAFSVTIDPDQDVLSTSKVSITIKVVPVGVARNIVVNIGLAVRVSN
tara:strand:- start:6286 stop:7479 length:1194 start_codon:yes stop_codon:yes gene_type:complete